MGAWGIIFVIRNVAVLSATEPVRSAEEQLWPRSKPELLLLVLLTWYQVLGRLTSAAKLSWRAVMPNQALLRCQLTLLDLPLSRLYDMIYWVLVIR